MEINIGLINLRLQEEQRGERQRKLISALLTFLLVAMLAAILIFFGLPYLDPPPPEEGVMVSMGTPDGGTTDETPQQAQQQQASSSPQTEESYETQDIEDAPVENNTQKQTKPTPTPTQNKPKEDPKPQLNDAWDFGKNRDNSNSGSGGKPGNEGDPNGVPGGVPGGTGGNGTGGDWALGGRSLKTRKTPTCNFGSNQTVVMKIKVDRTGTVTSAECVLKYGNFKGTTLDKTYCDCAKNGALGFKFDSKSSAAAEQEGAIKFEFKVH